jgi:hypothetical protein
LVGGALLIITKAMRGGCLALIMETHLLRRTAWDHGNGRTGLYGLKRHGDAGMGIDDEGEWQLERDFFMEEFGAWWLVFLIFFRCVKKLGKKT